MTTDEQINEAIDAARESARAVIAGMNLPTQATNEAQRALQAKKDTPRVFADNLAGAIGPNLSLAEAQQAIRRYEDEWNRAGTTPKRRASDHYTAGVYTMNSAIILHALGFAFAAAGLICHAMKRYSYASNCWCAAYACVSVANVFRTEGR